ncbi:MAG: glucokinase, partial [Pseudanabaena sp.]
MTIVLAGDIGGTKTLLRLAEPDETAWRSLYEQRFASANYTSFSDVLHEFLAQSKQHLGDLPSLSAACFGIAGPVRDHRSQLTNLGWSFDSDRLATEFDIPKVRLINDFVAVGYGVLGLQP